MAQKTPACSTYVIFQAWQYRTRCKQQHPLCWQQEDPVLGHGTQHSVVLHTQPQGTKLSVVTTANRLRAQNGVMGKCMTKCFSHLVSQRARALLKTLSTAEEKNTHDL